MKTVRKTWLAAALVAALALGGCFGGNDDDTPVAANAAEVPDSAGASIAAFAAYILALNPNDDSAEPSAIKDSFAVPPDETSEPQALT